MSGDHGVLEAGKMPALPGLRVTTLPSAALQFHRQRAYNADAAQAPGSAGFQPAPNAISLNRSFNDGVVNPDIRIFILALLLAVSLTRPAPACAQRLTAPRTILWAWQRSEDLSYINPQEFAVAYLACSVLLSGSEVKTIWRQQPLKVPDQTVLIPVVRVDIDTKRPASLDAKMRHDLAALIARAADRPRSSGIQIDFDARLTERVFYTQVLTELRQSLPPNTPVSITALASWCLFDNWLTGLPVSETVPMMFSLGNERAKVLNYFQAGNQFRHAGCCDALGISLEDPQVNALMIPLTKHRKIPLRLYVFTKSAWTREKVDKVRLLAGDP